MERTVNFAAVSRVAKRVELKGIRLTEISAKCDPMVLGALEPEVDLECRIGDQRTDALEVVCDYKFLVHSEHSQVAEAAIRYLLTYDLGGTEPIATEDLAEFARANGALHSWPFVRELLYGLTSRMGYPPYTLPVMHFHTKPKKGKEAEVPNNDGAKAEPPTKG